MSTLKELIVNECQNCHRLVPPPYYGCFSCGNSEFAQKKLSGKGVIYTFVIMHLPAPGFENIAPYVFGVVRLEEGILVPTRIEACNMEELEIGGKVVFVCEDDKGYLFRAIE